MVQPIEKKCESCKNRVWNIEVDNGLGEYQCFCDGRWRSSSHICDITTSKGNYGYLPLTDPAEIKYRHNEEKLENAIRVACYGNTEESVESKKYISNLMKCQE